MEAGRSPAQHAAACRRAGDPVPCAPPPPTPTHPDGTLYGRGTGSGDTPPCSRRAPCLYMRTTPAHHARGPRRRPVDLDGVGDAVVGGGDAHAAGKPAAAGGRRIRKRKGCSPRPGREAWLGTVEAGWAWLHSTWGHRVQPTAWRQQAQEQEQCGRACTQRAAAGIDAVQAQRSCWWRRCPHPPVVAAHPPTCRRCPPAAHPPTCRRCPHPPTCRRCPPTHLSSLPIRRATTSPPKPPPATRPSLAQRVQSWTCPRLGATCGER